MMPKPTPGVKIHTEGAPSAFKPPATSTSSSAQDKGKYTSTGIVNQPDPGNRQAPKAKNKQKSKTETECTDLRR